MTARMLRSIVSAVLLAGAAALVGPFVPAANIVPATLGAVALTGMAVSLLLAARLPWLERVLGGPDRAYGWHRVAGYAAVLALVGHWMLAAPARGAFAPAAVLGEAAGLWAGFGILGMTLMAAIRAVPHRLWRASHWLMGPLFAVSVFHTFASASPLPVGSPPWMAMAGVSIAGLFGLWRSWSNTGRGEVPGQIVSVRRLQGAIEIEIAAEGLPSFRPGQFAALTVPALGSEPHVFTLAGGGPTTRRFGIRVAGGWTARLHEGGAPGMAVRIGPPRGRFLPRTDRRRPAQLWIAGGAGITPFLAALERMAPDHAAPIVLAYAHRGVDGVIGLDWLREAAQYLPQVTLVEAGPDARLTPDRLDAVLSGLPTRCDLFLCGPDPLKEATIDAWRRAGKRGRIRHEAFDFRSAWTAADLLRPAGAILRTVAAGLASLRRPRVRA